MSRARLLQWPMVVWLTIVWAALWGKVDLLVILSGALVGAAACLVFPLPRLRADVVVRPVAVLVLVGGFLVDVVVASARVTLVTVRRAPPRSALVQVDLVSRSDLVLTVVSELVSLVPGSVVVETRRATHTIFLHVLDAPDGAAVERARAHALDQEQRVLRAFAAEAPAGVGGSPAGGGEGAR